MKQLLPARSPRSRALAPAAAIVITAALLSGCAAGQLAQTAQEVTVVDGGSVEVGDVALRNVAVAAPTTGPAYPTAGNADLSLEIVNNATTTDALVAVSTPAAASVVITAPVSSAGSAAATTSPSVSPSVSTPASPTGVTPPAGSGAVIEIPATQLVSINARPGSGVVSLTGLTSPLVPGQTIQITFTFRNAGAVTTRIPVKVRPGQTGGATIAVSPSGEG